MIIGEGIMLGAGGEKASIAVTGLLETDTVTATNGSKTITGVWTQIHNPASDVPEGYTQLEYIESSKTQYIDTGFKPNQDTKAEIKYQTPDTKSHCIAGCDTRWKTKGFSFYPSDAEFGNTAPGGNLPRTGQITIDILDKGVLYRDGTRRWASTSQAFSCDWNFYIFAQNRNGALNEPITEKVYYCKIWDNGTLIRNFIPARRNSDSAIGMYDLANSSFYANAGSDTFAAGTEIPQTVGSFVIDKIKSYGTWNVSNGDGTKTANVLINAATEFEVAL